MDIRLQLAAKPARSALPTSEQARLQRISDYGDLIDGSTEQIFDGITALAANIFDTPISAICIAEEATLLFLGRCGFKSQSAPRAGSLCSHVLECDDVFCVPDVFLDERFSKNPLYASGKGIRFYAGVPLTDSDGFRIGVLSIKDTQTRDPLTAREAALLKSLAQIVIERLDRLRIADKLLSAEAEASSATANAAEANARLRDAIEFLPEAIIMMDSGDRIILWNKQYEEMFPETVGLIGPGTKYEELLRASFAGGKNRGDLGSDDAEAWVDKRLAEYRSKGGTNEHGLIGNRIIRYDQHKTSDGGTICTRVDITDAKRREESFHLLFKANPLPMGVYDLENLRMLAINDAALSHFGFSNEQVLGMLVSDFSPPEHRERTTELIAIENEIDSEGHDAILWKADGSHFIAAIQSRRMNYLGRKACLSTIMDVTEKRQQEQHIYRLAHHDTLTGLPNRLTFDEHLETLLEKSAGNDAGFAVLLVDLDHFKNVNDTLGHPIGDSLIVAAAKRLKKCARETDFVARLGGDEFAMILPMEGNSPHDIDFLADIMVAEMAKAFDIEGHQINIGISVGITFAPHDGANRALLLQNVDLALYRAKADGRGRYQCFEPQMHLHVLAKRTMELELRSAPGNRELLLYYQPLVDLRTQVTSGYEALLRWNHPVRGLISADEFVEVAEDTGLINPIGAWVLKEACREAAAWPAQMFVAVNLSAKQFKDPHIVDGLQRALAYSGLPANRLELEITETALLENSDNTTQVLQKIKDLGVAVAMDDFGTGYSSISYLQKVNFDKIKIDRSFITGLATSPRNLEIVRAILAIGKSLNIRILAEGIETESEYLTLRELGCHEGQGYYFGRPMSAKAMQSARKQRQVSNI